MEAVDELEKAAAWYERESPDALHKWRHAVRQTLDAIRRSPKLWAADENGIRRVQIKPFSYQVIYGLKRSVIEIYAIAHTSRDEGYWQNRMKRP